MNKFRFSLLLIGLFLFSFLAQAADGTVNAFYYNEFLPSSYISSITQDKKGYIYFASSDWISCFDGYSMTHLQKPEETGSQRPVITKLWCDSSNHLWIATLQGLFCYDIDNQKYQYILFYQDDVLHKSNIIYDIAEDSKHTLYFATRNGIFSLKGKNAQPVRLKSFAYHENLNLQHKSERIATTLLFDKNDNLWVGTEGNGLSLIHMREHNASHYSRKMGALLPSDFIQTIHEDVLGMVWIGSSQGVAIFDPFKNLFSELPALHSVSVFSITSDKRGNVYLGTNNGLYLYEQNTHQISHFRNNPLDNHSLCSDYVKCVYHDRSEALWIGTQRGVSLYESAPEFSLYQHIPSNPVSLPSNQIQFLVSDEVNQRLYIGSLLKGLSVFYPQRNLFEPLSKTGIVDVSSYGSFLCGALLSDHTLLVGTENGLLQYAPETGFRDFPFNHLLPDGANVYAVVEDENQNLYLSVLDHGLYFLNKKKQQIQQLTLVADDKHQDIFTNIKILHRDHKNRIWVVYRQGGLVCYDPYTHKTRHLQVDTDPMLLNNTIWSLLENSHHQLMIGTIEGVAVYDLQKECFVSNSAFDPLRSFVVFGMEEDQTNHTYWFSTDNGIVRIHPNTGDFVLFSEKDQLQGASFNYQSCVRYQNRLFFGGDNGLNAVYFRKKMDYSFLPTPAIVSIRVDNRNLSLESLLEDGETVIKIHQHEPLEIGLSAFSYQKMWRNSFRYQFVGLDSTYQYLVKENHLIFRNQLPQGRYQLMVSASNSAGIWSTPQQLAVVVVKANSLGWYLFALFLLLLILGTVFVRERLRANKSPLKTKMAKNHSANSDFVNSNKAFQEEDGLQEKDQLSKVELVKDSRNLALIARLDEIMEQECPYLNKRFTKTQLAGMMKITEIQLSQLLKDYRGKGYNDYINEYRVNYFKQMIHSEGHKEYTLLSIGIECGFNSKTSFYRVFKSITGLTPSEYIEQVKREKQV